MMKCVWQDKQKKSSMETVRVKESSVDMGKGTLRKEQE